MAPEVPPDEASRLERLRALAVLDTPPEPLFDGLARLAAEACAAPLALIGLIDDRRLWFKARAGLPVPAQLARAESVCRQTIQADVLFEVADLAADARFAGCPLVAAAPHLRFYAGVPLRLAAGERVGTLCVMDPRVRRLDAAQAALLQRLAQSVAQALEMRSAVEVQLRAMLDAQVVSDRVLAERAQQQLQQQVAGSERFLRQLTDSLPVRIAYLDHERRYRFVNQEWLVRNRQQRDQVIGRTRSEIWPGRDDPLLRQHAGDALAGNPQQFEFDDRVDGQLLRIENRLIPDRGDDGEVRGFFVAGIDITERSRAEVALARQAATLRSVADAIPATVAVLDPQGRYRFVNRAFALAAGLPPEQILGGTARSILGDAEMERRLPYIQRALQGEAVSFELHHESRDGPRHSALDYIPLRLPDGAVDGFVVVQQDVTAHKREQARWRELSETDPLTRLLNRAGFEHRLANMLDLRRPETLAVLYLDLDHFKRVNDSHGHAAGDELLKIFAKRLVRLVRPTDAVARLGGDEFAVLLPGVHEIALAERVAQHIVDAAGQPFHLGGGLQARIGASVGGALGQALRGDWQRLLAQADRMLYQAKGAGRNRYFIDGGAPA